MKVPIELDCGERSFIVNALASFIDVLESSKKVFPTNEDLQEDATFKIGKAKDLILKIESASCT